MNKVYYALFLFLFLSASFNVLAAEPPRATSSANRVEKMKNEMANKKKEAIQKMCSQVTARINDQIIKYSSNSGKQVTAYTQARARLVKNIAEQKAKGLDTSKLENSLKEFDIQIKNMQQNREAYIKKLKETQNYGCGTSEGKFKTTVKEVHAVKKEVKQEHKSVLGIFDSIKSAIMNFRNQK